MKPIHEVTEDCKICIKGIIHEYGRTAYEDEKCFSCQGTGKITKLIFNIDNFMIGITQISTGKKLTILPKKGETKEIYEDFKVPENFKRNNEDIRNYGDHFVWNNNGAYRVRQFHLTKDAEVKSVGTDIDDQFYNLITSDIKYPLLIDFMEKHNLSDNSKIVICEGYYVN